jgi:hypothetical protein
MKALVKYSGFFAETPVARFEAGVVGLFFALSLSLSLSLSAF